MKKFEKVFENAQFLVLALLIVAQCVIGESFFLGQGLYLVANIISATRCFVLKRPLSDKVKDIACTGLTIGLIVLYMI